MYLTGAPPPYGSPPYGSSLYNGHAMPRYGIPQLPPGSGYQYGYGARLPMGSPYGPPVHMTGPPPYSGGSMIGAGKMAMICLLSFGALTQISLSKCNKKNLICQQNATPAVYNLYLSELTCQEFLACQYVFYNG